MSENYIFCPACSAINDVLNRSCVNCGESLIIVCPRCNTVNAVTAEKCFACSLQFDTLGQIMARHEVRFTDRFTRQATTANEITAAQKAGDQARSQELWAEERRRQEYLQAQKLRQKLQERYLIIGVAVVVVVVLAIVMLVALAS
jgi:phage FluMu protein Com